MHSGVMMMVTTAKKKKTEQASNPVGRPKKFDSVEKLKNMIDGYFASCHNELNEVTRPYTITGLALALDTNRQTLLEYEKNDDEFTDTIKKAKLRIENFAEESLFTSKQTAGVIFNLVNNHKWTNKQDIEHSGKMALDLDIDRMDDSEILAGIEATLQAIDNLKK